MQELEQVRAFLESHACNLGWWYVNLSLASHGSACISSPIQLRSWSNTRLPLIDSIRPHHTMLWRKCCCLLQLAKYYPYWLNQNYLWQWLSLWLLLRHHVLLNIKQGIYRHTSWSMHWMPQVSCYIHSTAQATNVTNLVPKPETT